MIYVVTHQPVKYVPKSRDYQMIAVGSCNRNIYPCHDAVGENISKKNYSFCELTALYWIPFHFIHDSWIAICAPWFGEIAFIDKPLIMYRQHANNSSGFTLTSSDKVNQGKQKAEKKTGSVYKTEEPNNWFNNPCHYYMCSAVFNERMRSVVDNDYAKLIDKSIRYHNTIMKCLPKQKFLSFIRLGYLFVIGDYRLFRGNAKQLIRDIYYIISNKNIDFTYDTSVW